VKNLSVELKVLDLVIIKEKEKLLM